MATKFGIIQSDGSLYVNSTPEYVKKACEASLKRLDVDCIDLYYAHRVDPKIPIEETVSAMAELVKEGKILSIGLSEVDAGTMRRANTVHPVAAIQTEFSLGTRKAAELVLPTCEELGITFVAYSPIGRGLLSGKIRNSGELAKDDWHRSLPQFQNENMEANLDLVAAIDELAAKKNCTSAQLSLAWLMTKHKNVIPIPGTRRQKYLKENIAAVDIVLTNQDIEALEKIYAAMPLQGDRLPPSLMELFQLKC